MTDKELMKLDMTTKLAMLLIDKGVIHSAAEAVGLVVNSDTYERLQNDQTTLYYQSPLYVFDYLHNELVKGKIE